MNTLGKLGDAEIDLLNDAWEATLRNFPDQYRKGVSNGEIFWFNVGSRTNDMPAISEMAPLRRWIDDFLEKNKHSFDEGAAFDRCSFIVNPVESKCQKWHVDYNFFCSQIFIPLSPLTLLNALQYVDDSHKMPLSERQSWAEIDNIDFNKLTQSLGSMRVSQVVSAPYLVHYLKCGVIHRGIANSGDFDRIMFNISLRHAENFEIEEETVSTENTPTPTLHG